MVGGTLTSYMPCSTHPTLRSKVRSTAYTSYDLTILFLELFLKISIKHYQYPLYANSLLFSISSVRVQPGADQCHTKEQHLLRQQHAAVQQCQAIRGTFVRSVTFNLKITVQNVFVKVDI